MSEPEMLFLTNGYDFIGPYFSAEIRAITFGTEALRYDGYRDVYRIKATTLEEAKREWSKKK